MQKHQVTVTAVPPNIVPLIKSLRLVANLGLKDAKNLADFLRGSLPCVLVAGIDPAVADHVVKLLQEAGAGVAAEQSPLSVPMLLCPQANQRHRWTWLGTRTTVDD